MTEKALQTNPNGLSPFASSLFAGAISGASSTLILQPFDLIKTKIQNSKCGRNIGMIDVTKMVVRNEGLFGLWRGLTPTLVRTVPGVGIYLASLEFLKALFFKPNDKLQAYQNLTLGAVARTIPAVLMIPITIVKTRFESGMFNYKGISNALHQIYEHEGLKGLTRGLIPTIVRDSPFSGIYYMIYMKLKACAVFGYPDALNNFSCGILAGSLASIIIHPADVVKTRMQLTPTAFPSARQATRDVWIETGFRGFFLGLAPRLVRRTLFAALTWSLFETLDRKFRQKI